jgi:hypothetical protein
MVKEKKRMGRPPAEVKPYPLQVTVSQEQLNRIDNWRRTHTELPSRTEAVRQMIDLATKGAKK